MLSHDRRRRLERQLIELQTVERPQLLSAMASVDGKDPADQADRMTFELQLAQVDARIQRLRDLMTDEGATGTTSAREHDVTLVLDFGNGPEPYQFGALGIDDGRDVITPGSPLGRALAHATAGQRVSYATPRGAAFVNVVSIGGPADA